jgi:hypothetical protein
MGSQTKRAASEILLNWRSIIQQCVFVHYYRMWTTRILIQWRGNVKVNEGLLKHVLFQLLNPCYQVILLKPVVLPYWRSDQGITAKNEAIRICKEKTLQGNCHLWAWQSNELLLGHDKVFSWLPLADNVWTSWLKGSKKGSSWKRFRSTLNWAFLDFNWY